MPTLTDLPPELHTEILRNLEIPDVIAVSRTCKKLSPSWRTFKEACLNINVLLNPFFSNPRKFRSIQGECDGLVIYKEARWFFTRAAIGNCLPILLGKKHIQKLATYLESEGYTSKDYDTSSGTVRHDPHYDNSVDVQQGWVKYCNFDKRCGGGTMVALAWDAHDVGLLGGWFREQCLTAELNFITWNKAYCLFPQATLQEKEAYLLCGPEVRDEITWEDFADDGLKSTGLAWPTLDPSKQKHPITSRRRIGDAQTLVVEFNTDGVAIPEKPDAVIESSVFQLVVVEPTDPEDEDEYEDESPVKYTDLARYCMDFIIIGQHVLKWDYMIPGSFDSPYGKFTEKIIKHLDQATILELQKLPDRHQAKQYRQLVTDSKKLDLPQSWTFWDKKVVPMLLEGSKQWVKNDD
jgi:hypothetical protein